jgi:hypothetical protein
VTHGRRRYELLAIMKMNRLRVPDFDALTLGGDAIEEVAWRLVRQCLDLGSG